MKNVGYYNGEIGLIEDMVVPLNDRGYYFGDGVYDALYAANRKMFDLQAHLRRFQNSVSIMRMPFDLDEKELEAELQKCVDLMDSDEPVMVYWQCTRGTGSREHTFLPENERANLAIMVRDIPPENLRRPRKALLVEDTRFFHCNVKTINLLPNVMAAQAAKEAGCDEAIFHRGERVTECAHSNVHIIENGVFRTAPLDNLILPGTARRRLLLLCDKLGIPSSEKPYTVDELMNADEVIVTSSGTLGARVREIDGKEVGGRDEKTLRALQQAFIDEFEEETGYHLDII